MASFASKLARAARSASAHGGFAPRLPGHDLPGVTTFTTWTRKLLAPAAAGSPLSPRFLRRGLATPPAGEDSTVPLPVGAFPEDMEDEDSPYYPSARVFKFDEKDVASEESLWALYERWCIFYDVKRDHDDKVRRFEFFKWTARHVYEFNKSGMTYTKGFNSRSDWTFEERTPPRRPPRPPTLCRPMKTICAIQYYRDLTRDLTKDLTNGDR